MKVRIIQTEDQELNAAVKQALKDNDGYCPCKIFHLPENKCMCKDFREQEIGSCHCGLYIKVLEEEKDATKSENDRQDR